MTSNEQRSRLGLDRVNGELADLLTGRPGGKGMIALFRWAGLRV